VNTGGSAAALPRAALAECGAVGEVLAQAAQLHGAGQLLQAETLYRRVLNVQGRNAQALHLLGVCLHQRGELVQAHNTLAAAARAQPAEALIHLSLGEVLRGLGQFREALASYQRACALAPGNVLALVGKAIALESLNRYAQALEAFDAALAQDGGSVDANAGRANCLLLQGRLGEALAAFDRALALAPGHRMARANRAVALTQAHRAQQALADYDALLAGAPADAAALAGRANALYALERYDDALADVERALALQPDFEAARVSRAVILMALRRHDAAREELDGVLARRPDHADAHVYRAMCLLAQERLAEAWPDFEWRESGSRRPGAAAALRVPGCARSLPRWTAAGAGAALRGRSVLLQHEQGYGDTLQFVRYAALVRERGARTVLCVQPALAPLLRGAGIADQVLAQGEELPGVDLACPLMSVPYTLGAAGSTAAGRVPYIAAPVERVARWRQRLGDDPRPRIGLAWAGNAANTDDRRRSVALERLVPALVLPGRDGGGADPCAASSARWRLLALQPQVNDADRACLRQQPAIEDLGPELRDFADTAAVIALCDLVISVDTVLAHLAGAMGRPVWVLLAFAADWRWHLRREDSPWYPSARLFRQPAPGDWPSVVVAVRSALWARHGGVAPCAAAQPAG